MASLLECRLEDVPDLYDPTISQDLREIRKVTEGRLCLWLKERGVYWLQLFMDDIPYDEFEIAILPTCFQSLYWGRPHLIAGQNQDGIGHICIGNNGKIIHDPNPLRRGLVTVAELGLLLPLDAIPDSGKEIAEKIGRVSYFVDVLDRSNE
jgi:hypothetical protein